MVTFVIGGMTGVLLAVPPADFVLHNSLFLVAHFHNVIIGGVLFGAFAGYTYWFPKAFGFRLHEGLGKAAFWCWLIGFYVAFMPLYVAGPDGHDPAHAALRRRRLAVRGCWSPRAAPLLILVGIVLPDRAARRQHPPARAAARRDRRSLERPLARMVDRVAAARLQLRRAAAGRRRGGLLGHEAARAPAGGSARSPAMRTIEMPRNSADRLHLRVLRHLHGLRADLAHLVDGRRSAALGAYATFVVFAWRDEHEDIIPADEVARIDRANRSARGEALAGVEATHERRLDATAPVAGHARASRSPADGEARAPANWHVEADRRRLRLLDLPAQRHRHVLRVLRHLCGAGRSRRRAARAGGPVRPAQCRDRDGLPAAVELHLRHCQHRRQRAQRLVFYGAHGGDVPARCRVHRASSCASSPAWSPQGAGPTRSAFLSAFFTLVGCHGLHVTAGLLWLLTMMAQVFAKGYRPDILRRMLCFSLFWHALDIIWVALFTVVYLMGVAT